jgi:putative tricarboxylic transport membrane protein
LAQVPTWREQGIAADFVSYNGILLPPNMTAAQISFWEEALRKVSQHSTWTALVEKNGGRPVFRDHAESMKYMLSEQKAINDLVQELGLGAK